MLEFLRLLKSLLWALCYFIYNNYIVVLRKHYTALSDCVVKKQRLFIILPVSVAFILSYPSIYSVWYEGFTNYGYGYRTDLRYDDGSNQVQVDNNLEIMQVWLKWSDDHSDSIDTPKNRQVDIISPDALSKNFLRKVWTFQDILLDGIPININNNNREFYVHSPLSFWNYNLTELEQDDHVLRTVNNKVFSSNLSGKKVLNTGLFGDVVKVNGLIKSAKFLRIVILLPKNSRYIQVWNSNLNKYLQENNSRNFKIVNQAQDHEGKVFSLQISEMNSIDHFILALSYILIGVYFTISLINLKSLRSKIGLMIGYSVEIILSILSSATLTSYFYQGVDFQQIPLQFLPFIVIVVSVENMFRLVASITSISETQRELSIQHKLSIALTECGLTSSLTVLIDCFIFWTIYPFVSKFTQKFLMFVSFALIIDHILHLTYFASMLTIDLHRLDLTDLLNDQNDGKSWSKSILEKYQTRLPFSSHSEESSTRRFFITVRKLYEKIKFPLSTTVFGTVIVTVTLIIMNIRWSNDTFSLFKNSSVPKSASSSIDTETALMDLNEFINRNGLNDEILSLVKMPKEIISIDIEKPTLLVLNTTTDYQFPLNLNTNISYKFDIYYISEFLALLVFILSFGTILLRYFTKNLTFEDEDKSKDVYSKKEDCFKVKVLSGGHYLDIIKIATSRSSFIASVGLDHKILIWSPISKPLPKPTQLPIAASLWPIVNVVISDSGNFIAVFSNNGVVQCWSRLAMTWVWKFEIFELKGQRPLETFFRYKTVPGFLQRKRAAAQNLSRTDELSPRSRRSSLMSIASPKLNSTGAAFGNNMGLNDVDSSEDFIIVLNTGTLVTISCQGDNNSISRESLNTCKLVSSAKLITPRVNDRLVSYTEEGKILVSIAVNNKWKSRAVNIFEDSFNNPKRGTPPGSIIEDKPEVPGVQETFKTQIAIVPFVGFIVKTNDSFAELIDVQTGTLIKKIKITHSIKPKSLKVFHAQPTHCRFCGSVSIASFSIAYSLLDQNSMVMHTFKADHKAKPSICLRVERDPREIRCVGFDQVTEHISQVDNIDGWCCDDQNEIMGLKKKSEEEIIESLDKFKKSSTLRQRRTGGKSTDQQLFDNSDASRLYDLWEGWKLDADGKFEILKIPDIGNSEGLLVNSIGEISRFGHKSLVVVFGNIMKILYLGNDELIYHENPSSTDTKSTQSSSSDPQQINGLNFINRRRKLNRDKQNERFTSISSFSEIDSIQKLAL